VCVCVCVCVYVCVCFEGGVHSLYGFAGEWSFLQESV